VFGPASGAGALAVRRQAERQVPDTDGRAGPAIHSTSRRDQEARYGVKPLSADQVISALGLTPHPEGGFFRETFRAPASVAAPFAQVSGAASTAIYFLLRAGDFSAFHSVRSDEVWHHYLGATLELHTIDPTGGYERIELGPNLLNGELPQWVVPANHLQGARIIGDGFGLFGCTVAPAFDFADFSMPERSDLVARFPSLADLIESFTR
jgi:uncharacterized protein